MIEEYKEIIAWTILIAVYFFMLMPVIFNNDNEGYLFNVIGAICLHIALAVIGGVFFIICWAFKVVIS